MVNIDISPLNEVNTSWHNIKLKDSFNWIFSTFWVVCLDMLLSKRCHHHGDQFVVRFEPESWFIEQNIKCDLELLKERFFYDFDFHVLWELLIKFIILQENIWTALEVLQRVVSIIFNDLSWNLHPFWQLTAYFDNQILNFFNHKVCVLSWWYLINVHERLHFLDSQRVKKHADKLKKKNR